MKIEITGNKCISCYKYTQYYQRKITSYDYEPIECGFCGVMQRTTRPGNRCKHYKEISNVSLARR